MKKLLLINTLAATAACTAVSAPQTPPSTLPTAVQEEVKRDAQICREAGGDFALGDAVFSADLNHDGHTDYIYDAGLTYCANAPGFSGNSGAQVTVFAGQADGSAQEAFKHGAHGASLIDGKLYLGVGGQLCGQNTTGKSRAEYEGCIRPLVWNAGKQVFEFAPVAQIRPLPQSWER
ncbi:hypothetical protein L1281_001038 [Neisseria sp. HSC-16F19]|nr:hypothetical protein [Neisseria sp. HSC-16F19]MCP2040455.1 hypothetical protein [Neisseria sp. HSC-16F19]